jgi:hypothetical protein
MYWMALAAIPVSIMEKQGNLCSIFFGWVRKEKIIIIFVVGKLFQNQNIWEVGDKKPISLQ